jgi:hypothetical protein
MGRKTTLAAMAMTMLIGLIVGCDEQCISLNDDRCISEWMKEGRYPYLTCEEVEKTFLTGQIFSGGKIDIYHFDGHDAVAMAWASDGRIVFVSTLLPNYREFGVLVESLLLFELLKLDMYQNAATYGCDLETDITSDEIQTLWDSHVSRPVFVCQGSGQPSELPDYSRVIYVLPPPTTFNLEDLGSFKIQKSENDHNPNGNYAISTCN